MSENDNKIKQITS